MKASGAALSFAVIAMSSAARAGAGPALKREVNAAIDATDAVMSPSALGASPPASTPSNASFAIGESSAMTKGLGAPFAAASGSLSAPRTAMGALRQTADRLKRS